MTPRELEMARLVARGYSNAEIAKRLRLRTQTVKNRLSEIYMKTGVKNRLGLALLVSDTG